MVLRYGRTARLPAVPAELNIAKTLSCSTSTWVSATVSAGLLPSSTTRYSILRPLTPPRPLTYLKYASAPREAAAYAAEYPVSGAVPPSRIVLDVTPGSFDRAVAAIAAVAPATSDAPTATSVSSSFGCALGPLSGRAGAPTRST